MTFVFRARLVVMLALGVLCMSIAPAFAGAIHVLQGDETKRFVASLGDVQDFSNKMQAAGKNDFGQVSFTNMAGQPFDLYSRHSTEFQSRYPAEYKEFEGLVAKYGFSSASEWSAVADSVMSAFLVQDPKMQVAFQQIEQQMPPEILSKMPEQTRKQMEAGMAMVKTLKQVPQDNITAVKPFAPQIKEFVDGINK